MADKGSVVLTWNCQYDGVKAISVLRSADSGGRYRLVGYVKKLNKGTEVFTDEDPLSGQAFYKLTIRFSSGLTWNSNHVGVYVPDRMRPSRENQLAANDIAKQTAMPKAVPQTDQQPGAGRSEKKALQELPKTNRLGVYDTQSLRKPAMSLPPGPDTGKAINALLESSHISVAPRQKITISYDDSYENSAALIRSRFIFVDPVSGHINMTLPDDVHTHHYSIKFYDQKNKMIIDVPRINAADIIIDKRNFQRKGSYKFILRRDALELESGYIAIY
jgi:hypothetical protein